MKKYEVKKWDSTKPYCCRYSSYERTFNGMKTLLYTLVAADKYVHVICDYYEEKDLLDVSLYSSQYLIRDITYTFSRGGDLLEYFSDNLLKLEKVEVNRWA